MIAANHLQISNIARLLTEDPDLIEGRKGNWRAGLTYRPFKLDPKDFPGYGDSQGSTKPQSKPENKDLSKFITPELRQKMNKAAGEATPRSLHPLDMDEYAPKIPDLSDEDDEDIYDFGPESRRSSVDQINLPRSNQDSSKTVAVTAKQSLPNGIPDLNSTKGHELKRVLHSLPIAVVNGKTYTISLKDISLPDTTRLMTGGGTSQAHSSPSPSHMSKEGISDLQVRQILSALRILKDDQIGYDIFIDNNKIVGLRFKDAPLNTYGRVNLGELLNILTEAVPDLVSKLYQRNWEGKYGEAFAELVRDESLEVTPYPDLSDNAQAVITPNRKNTVLILQPDAGKSGGTGYLLYKEVEFPAETKNGQSIMLPWYDAVPYFMRNIDYLAPNWRREKDNRKLLAFRHFLYGKYKHRRTDGTLIGRQGMAISRHAENSIDILKAYVKPGKGWKEYIKNPQTMPGQMFEQKSFNHYIKFISQNTLTELR